MKFTCNSDTLQKSLSIVSKAISKRSTLPIMENILLDLKGTELSLRGHDLEIGIEQKITVDSSGQDGVALIKADTMGSIMSKMETQCLEVSANESNKILIKAEQVDFDILGNAVEEYPVFPSIETGHRVKMTADTLVSFIKHTLFAVSMDETKPFLNGVLVKVESGILSFVATDGFRLALATTSFLDEQTSFSMIVPYKTMNELHKVLLPYDGETEVEMNISPNQITFMVPGFVLISRLIEGQFPDYNQVLPQETANHYSIPTKLFLSAAERAAIIASHSNNVVRLIFNKDTIRVKAHAAKLGEFKEDLQSQRLQGEGEFSISYNVKLLLDALKNIQTDDLFIRFNHELSPCVIKPSDSETPYTYIVMPIRTGDFESVDETSSAEAAS
ncbi:DNA polymerase III subunit beta [Candidatus Marinamargulisbacteria bacterium SCGC AG-439-L15]|nr:DNA polymerase III subunit beta [Candidatus Marinamargulisbacteria bacterium SCGC AG-439-L15]